MNGVAFVRHLMGMLDPLGSFGRLLPSEKAAVDYFTARRWRNGEYCPYCGYQKLYHWATRGRYSCSGCGHTFSIKTRSLFHNSSRPVRQWLAVVWLATNTKRGLTIRGASEALQLSAFSASSMIALVRYGTRTASFRRQPAVAGRGDAVAEIVDVVAVGHHYERKLKIDMPFEAAMDRLADIGHWEVEAARANSPRLQRVQRTGWRGKMPLVEIEPIDDDDDSEADLRRDALVGGT